MADAARTLLLPVETIAREFDGKLLLALIARERGWRVYLGDQTVLRERFAMLPRGVYLSKSAQYRNAKVFKRMHSVGTEVAILDEEALVRQSDHIYMLKHEKDALEHVGLLMTWGEDNSQLWVNSGKYDHAKIHTTGNPRVDMLRGDLRDYHKPEMDDFRARFGDYVLFNGNFATVNHFMSGKTRFGLARWVSAEERGRQQSMLLCHKKRIFEGFLRLLPKVAKAIAPLTLVIRPHPSEAHQPWEAAVAGQDNVVVTFESSVVPWLAGAKALIHNGCTTAVEAAILGTTSLCFRPVKSESFDNRLPNELSLECETDESVLDALRKVIADGPRPLSAEQQATLNYFVSGQTGPLSCDNIMDSLDSSDLGGGRRGAAQEFSRLPVLLWEQGPRLKRAAASFYARGRARQAYRARKFPELTLDFFDNRIDRFRKVLGRFDHRGARQVSHNLFVLD